jgi:hypothetical protein
MFEVINSSIQRHPTYKAETRAFNRMNTSQERPQTGVTLQSTSSTRVCLSADSYIGDLKSHVNLVRAGNAPGSSMEWVWEDSVNITKRVTAEDVSASLSTDGFTIRTSHHPICSGYGNTIPATNFGQIDLKVNGLPAYAIIVVGTTGTITLANKVLPTDVVTVSYYYNNLDLPGFYYTEMITDKEFVITPMYSVYDEVVIAKTTGIEISANTHYANVLTDYVLTLYTKKTSLSVSMTLVRDVEYTIQSSGLITFLNPLQKDTTLYATYRYQGANRGPFTVSKEYEYNNTAIRGVVMSFGSRKILGDKQVVILTPARDDVAAVYGGHYTMTMEWRVFTRDPESTAELTDHIVSDIWANVKEPLRFEGITIENVDATGESEEMYDESTQAPYWQNTISMQILTEWKNFKPYVTNLNKYNLKLVINDGTKQSYELWVDPKEKAFNVLYPVSGYPVFF